MCDTVIPLNEIGKFKAVKVYNQAYVDRLEKENAALKNEVELWKKASENNSFKAFQSEKENKELREINAELRNQFGLFKQKDNEVWKDVVDKSKLIEKNLELHTQLTKAKDFLKTTTALLETFNSSNGSLDKLIIDIKQFLEEAE